MASPSHGPALRRAVTAGAAVGATAAALRALGRPLPKRDGRLLDWEAARRTAHRRCGESPQTFPGNLGPHYDAIAASLSAAVTEVTEEPPIAVPAFQVLDRRGFVDANFVIARRLTGPVEQVRAGLPETRATALGRAGMSRYLGELFGFISKRVLGQYDPVLTLADQPSESNPALYIVESNVRTFETRSGAPGEDLRRWLILHELTHAWQFGNHPWLAEHLTSLIRGLVLDGLMAQVAQRGAAPATRVGGSAGLLKAVPGGLRVQLRAAARVQAVMSVLEGHSNFVMHQAGRRHIAHFDDLERAFHRRADERSTVERLVLAVTGMKMKLRQYEVGEQFCTAVTKRGGFPLLNRVWEGPSLMPTAAELKNPSDWVRRAGS